MSQRMSDAELRRLLGEEEAPVPAAKPPRKIGGWTFLWLVVLFFFMPWRALVQLAALLLAGQPYYEDR